jgi:NADH-quinone oxidoreductase subunit M
MLTLLLIIIPFISALVLLLLKSNASKSLALGLSLVELALAVYAVWFAPTADLNYNCPWVPQMGIQMHLSMDGISALMVLLAAVLMPIIVYATDTSKFTSQHTLFALMMAMQGAMLGAFTAMDGFVFYIFWELSLLPIFFMMLWWGGENKKAITIKFFIYTIFGSLFMLLALIYLYTQTSNHSFDIQALYAAGKSLPVATQGLLMGAFFIAFAVKMPVFPFHTWQPDTYNTAPLPGVMLLAAVMSKMATYGLLRWVLPMLPEGVATYGHWIIVLSVISIVYASMLAIVQKDFRYLIAYASIAHIGLVSAGVFAANQQSVQGSLIEMFSHGVNTVGLFFIYQIIYKRYNSSEMSELGGIRGLHSGFAFLSFIIVLGVIALPFTNGFIGEFLMLLGVFKTNATAAVFAGLSIIFGAVYMLRAYQKMMLGETKQLTHTFEPLSQVERNTLIIIVVLVVGLGVFPKPLLDLTETTVQNLLNIK